MYCMYQYIFAYISSPSLNVDPPANNSVTLATLLKFLLLSRLEMPFLINTMSKLL